MNVAYSDPVLSWVLILDKFNTSERKYTTYAVVRIANQEINTYTNASPLFTWPTRYLLQSYKSSALVLGRGADTDRCQGRRLSCALRSGVDGDSKWSVLCAHPVTQVSNALGRGIICWGCRYGD